jgi:GNAT superfamily N-acetyltransferase
MDEPGTHTNTSSPAFRWIPIRSLSERHRARVLTHLLTLTPEDRYLRFGYVANDAQIGHYVDLLDFRRDEVFGVFNRKLDLIALAHLAYLPLIAQHPASAEFGVSVLAKARSRGYGARLFDHAVLHARNRHVQTLIIHALSENTAMLKIARASGAKVVRDGSESEARLSLPKESLASHLEAIVEDQAAEFDYQIKTQAQRMDLLLDFFGVRHGHAKERQAVD